MGRSTFDAVGPSVLGGNAAFFGATDCGAGGFRPDLGGSAIVGKCYDGYPVGC